MSRWSKAFAAFSGGSDTLDTMGHSGDQHPTVSQSVDSVTADPSAISDPDGRRPRSCGPGRV